jgi:hypothetical protein
MSQPPLVIYHAPCYDGFTAAWAFHTLVMQSPLWNGPPEYVPAKYGDPPPDTMGRELWVLDFSYPREIMKKMIIASKRATICDHHKTAEADLKGLLDEIEEVAQRKPNDRIIFDMERSGAGITWDTLIAQYDRGRGYHKPGGRHWLVDYIEDRDLWKLALPNSKEVSAWIAAQPYTFEAWDALATDGAESAALAGAAILKYMDNYGEKACDQAKVEDILGFVVPTMNLPYMNCSEHVGRLLEKNPQAPFAVGYFRRFDGRWQFSLRSRPDFDVSNVAKAYGGGGHAQAAGFDVATLPWDIPTPKSLGISAEDTPLA